MEGGLLQDGAASYTAKGLHMSKQGFILNWLSRIVVAPSGTTHVPRPLLPLAEDIETRHFKMFQTGVQFNFK